MTELLRPSIDWLIDWLIRNLVVEWLFDRLIDWLIEWVLLAPQIETFTPSAFCFSVLADANFPSSSTCRHGPRELRADGQAIPELLRSILQLFPLDQYEAPVLLMDLEPVDKERKLQTPIWQVYEQVIEESEKDAAKKITVLPRFDFYKRAEKAFAVVHTSEAALYGNIILKKGVIPWEKKKENRMGAMSVVAAF